MGYYYAQPESPITPNQVNFYYAQPDSLPLKWVHSDWVGTSSSGNLSKSWSMKPWFALRKFLV